MKVARGRKTPKYQNHKTVVAGITFDSRKEADRYRKLHAMQLAGLITDLRRQVSFDLIPKQKREDGRTEVSVRYVADFVYVGADGRGVVEDVKSPPTRKLPAYVLKRKLMLWRHGITISEV